MKVYYKCVETGVVGDSKTFNLTTAVLRRSVRSGKPVKAKPHYHFVEDHREYAENHTNQGRVGTFTGKHHSEATRRLLSEQRLGKSFKRRGLVVPEGWIALVDVPYYTRSSLPSICEYEGIEIKDIYYKGQRIKIMKECDLGKLQNHKYNINGKSYWEREIQETFKEATRNRRDIIKPLELDLYFEAKKVAIECDGLYYHSELYTPATYHLNKTRLCTKQGVRLIHIFEDEWRDKKDICMSLINAALGKFERKVYARNCIVKDVPREEAKDFLDKNHMQGKCQFNSAQGLYLNGELLQMVAFRKSPFKKGELELARMVTKLNTQVLGGFSKLMKNYHNVVSYVDLRLFNASGYLGSGWQVIGQSNPAYFYTDFLNRFNRMNFMKYKIKDWKGNTEHEKCNNKGLFRIYDCGCLKVLWK